LKICNNITSSHRRFWCFLVCAFWSLGVFGGALLSDEVFARLSVIVRSIPLMQPSVAYLVFVRLGIGFLFVLLLRYSRPLFVLLLLAASFSYSYVVLLLAHSFGSAGWLVLPLVLAPDAVLLAWITYYAISNPVVRTPMKMLGFVILPVLVCTVTIIECYCIAPFTAKLF